MNEWTWGVVPTRGVNHKPLFLSVLNTRSINQNSIKETNHVLSFGIPRWRNFHRTLISLICTREHQPSYSRSAHQEERDKEGRLCDTDLLLLGDENCSWIGGIIPIHLSCSCLYFFLMPQRQLPGLFLARLMIWLWWQRKKITKTHAWLLQAKNFKPLYSVSHLRFAIKIKLKERRTAS